MNPENNYYNYNTQNYIPQGNYNPQNYIPQGSYNPLDSYNEQTACMPHTSVNAAQAAAPKKKGSRKIFIAAMAVSITAFLTVMTIFAIQFVNKNVKKGDEKERAYTIEDIKEMYGYTDMYEREYEHYGITYIMCYPQSNGSSRINYEEYHLIYLFDSAKDARTYFDNMKIDYFCNITSESEDVVEGWISGICDADEKDRCELKNNMIVIDTIEFVGYDF